MALSQQSRTTTATRDVRRWLVIGTVVLLAFGYGLQMYAMVPAFGPIAEEYGLDLTRISLLVSAFFLGYAIAHIPAGFAAAAFGYKLVAVVGSGMLAASSLMSSVADGFTWFLLSRLIGGMSMSIIVGSALPLAAAWAKKGQAKLVVGGFVNGFGFTAGAAVGLYTWVALLEAFGWRPAVGIAAGVGVVVTVVAVGALRVPADLPELDGGHFSWRGTLACLRSRSIWAIGVGSVSAYGILFTVSQLGPEYAEAELGFSTSSAGLLSATLLFLGIPGSVVGGVWGDRSPRFLPTLWIPGAVMVVLLAALPFAGGVSIWFVLAGIGLVGSMYFAPCTVSPSEYPDEVPVQDFGTALGLILTLGNAGAIAFPYIYAVTAESAGKSAGWWTLTAIAGLATTMFLLAREPRRNDRSAAEAGR
ncbi:MFS transporter [Saccharopolyspora mangrovi]|uniref:MFS transporter n=1 Tax=Saccharopolyspora mangrovi TaxID=3082379 RepID=A0ABU6AG37_9PSEU|nr:MFS transporter [Saccharopolyspora sp. S2-29]MEB3370526.1 MFS transporter [Saccharopolyspora sp. S2-29]